MDHVLENTSVCAGPLATLITFALMIVVGAVMNMLALCITNATTERMHTISDRNVLLNDTYKDMQRTRTGMSCLYSILRKNMSETAKTTAFASSEKDLKKAIEQMEAFENAPCIEGAGESLCRATIQAAQTHIEAVQRALTASRTGNAAAYAQFNCEDVTDTGAVQSVQIESFQQFIKKLTKNEADDGHACYEMILKFVAPDITMALALIVAVFYGFKVFVVTPLNEAVAVLSRMVEGDLAMHVRTGGRSELDRLSATVGRMRKSLVKTVRQVRNNSDSVNTNTHEIANGNLDLSSRTEWRSTSLGKTAVSIEQMTLTITNNSENVRRASALASSIVNLTSRGDEVVCGVVAAMDDISAGSCKMADIIGVTDGIAFQANILILNAAVEAARAGEQGRGFVVVADEVCTLVQRNAAATKEIKTLTDDSMSHVQTGHSQVAQASETITETMEAVRRMANIAEDIALVSVKQTQGVLQIDQAVTEMEQVTRQNAALIEQAAVVAQSLEEQAQNLTQVVS